MPRADTSSDIAVEALSAPTKVNPLGVKGCGEAGAIAAPAATINAVVDALWDLGVRDMAMPATASKIWQSIQAAKAAA